MKYPLHLVHACPVFREASGGTWSREVPDLPLSTSPRSCGSHSGCLSGNAKQRKAESTGKSVRRHHFKSLKGSCCSKSFDYWGMQTRYRDICFAFLHCVLLSSLALAHNYLPSRECNLRIKATVLIQNRRVFSAIYLFYCIIYKHLVSHLQLTGHKVFLSQK